MTSTGIPFSQRLPVEGTYNLRELGGLRAVDGRVRWGKLYRSDALAGLTPTGSRSIADLAIQLVIDLRTAAETIAEPTRLPRARIVHAPIFDGADLAGGAAAQPISLAAVYDMMIDSHGTRLTRAVRHVAHSGADPVLVHCAAGKDRTGLVVALSLLAAGVRRDDVVLDYSESEKHLAGEWAEATIARMRAAGHSLDDDARRLVTASPADLLDRIVDRWEAEWGSPLGFLQSHGFTAQDHAALRAALLD